MYVLWERIEAQVLVTSEPLLRLGQLYLLATTPNSVAVMTSEVWRHSPLVLMSDSAVMSTQFRAMMARKAGSGQGSPMTSWASPGEGEGSTLEPSPQKEDYLGLEYSSLGAASGQTGAQSLLLAFICCPSNEFQDTPGSIHSAGWAE